MAWIEPKYAFTRIASCPTHGSPSWRLLPSHSVVLRWVCKFTTILFNPTGQTPAPVGRRTRTHFLSRLPRSICNPSPLPPFISTAATVDAPPTFYAPSDAGLREHAVDSILPNRVWEIENQYGKSNTNCIDYVKLEPISSVVSLA
ncbi:hypothetical protein LXL04_019005 [Taraxacum kok-saghyz]